MTGTSWSLSLVGSWREGTAFALLSRGPAGEQGRDLWRAGDALFQVATTATRPNPADRYQSVAELIGAWQDAHGGRRPQPG